MSGAGFDGKSKRATGCWATGEVIAAAGSGAEGRKRTGGGT
ncbi:MAG: hypothetical protein ACKV22_37255 [Bryobacteraceae bacterium]